MIRRLSSLSRTFVLLLTAALILVSCKLRDSDGMALDRYGLSLNGSWYFRTDPDGIGEKQKWYLGESAMEWDSLTVPGTWDQRSQLSSYDGFGWYLRKFDAELEKGISHALIFDGVDDNAVIWLNGVNIGAHDGRGQRFFFDVSGIVQEKENVLAVRIENITGTGGLVGDVELRAFEREEELLRSKYYSMTPVESADWVRDAVVYEVYVRSFSKEGTFAALELRLPELQEMGITVLRLMPIHPVGKVNRKGSLGNPYSVQDFYAVNPEFGTLEDFKSLVAAAHVQGMHVIIDLVANHTAWDNPLLTEHPEWYTHDQEGRIVSPDADSYDVADLNYDAAGLRAWMKKMMLYWVRDIGIDGFRCDAAEMIPHDFWVDAITALREIKPVMMLAEGAGPDLHVEAFDLTYAWNTYDLLRPIITGETEALEIAPTLQREKYRYPRGSLHLRFTTNHDKSLHDAPPVLWLGPEAARACAVLMHMLPGVPLIYNGQEVGSSTPLNLFEKVGIEWSNDSLGFRELYTTLNAIRAAEQSARRGDMHYVEVSDSTAVFAFTRSIDEAIPVFTAINFAKREATFTCARHDDLEGQTLLSSGRVRLTPDSMHITLPAFGYVIIK